VARLFQKDEGDRLFQKDEGDRLFQKDEGDRLFLKEEGGRLIGETTIANQLKNKIMIHPINHLRLNYEFKCQ